MSRPDLDPDLLRAFVAVCEHLSFTHAARRLNRTQAAVSLQVQRLEERLGVKLFRRSTTRVEMTGVAESFLIDARRILMLSEQAVARLSHLRVAGQVRIGVMEDYGTRVIPRLLPEIAEIFPLVQIEMEIGLTARLLKRLGSSFDVVLAMHPEGAGEGDLVARESAAWVAARDHGIEHTDPLPVALSYPDCLFRQWAIEVLNASGRPWRLAYVSQSTAAIEALVEQGLAVSILKSSMLGQGLRRLDGSSGLPSLPGAEIRLHRAANISSGAALVADHLTQKLRQRG